MAYAIKAEIDDVSAKIFAFTAQKTMYGGKHVARGDEIFLFASEKEGRDRSHRARRRGSTQPMLPN